jgi:transposase
MSKIDKTHQKINFEKMIVAIDISKGTNWAVFRRPEGIDSKPIGFTNSRAGYNHFYSQIIWHMNKYNCRQYVVGMESTGVYGEPLLHYLESRNAQLVLVNPVHTKRIKEIRDNSPNKTDKKDPRVIADLIQLNCVLSVLIPKGYAAELRQLTHARERAIALRNGFISQLHAIVCKIFPEFFHVIKSLKGKTAQYLLRNYPDPTVITELSVDSLHSEVKRISRGRISQPKLVKYQELANETIGVKEGKRAILQEIKHLVDQLCNQTQFIQEIEKEISDILQKVPVSQRIMSIQGIGTITTATILGETGNFQNMQNSKEVEKLAGLNLFEISSGKHQGNKRISKRGRSLLRKILYFGALNVIKNDGVFKEKYQSYLKMGKPKPKALVAIARKLLRVIFAIVRDETRFDINYNQEQTFKKAA